MALLVAAEYNKVDVAELFLRHGADLKAVDQVCGAAHRHLRIYPSTISNSLCLTCDPFVERENGTTHRS